MIPYDHYFHDGAGPSDGWQVLDRLRVGDPDRHDAHLAEIISATAGSPPNSRLAVQALQRSGVSAESDAETDALDVNRVLSRSIAETSDDPEEVLEKVDEQVSSIGGPAEHPDA